MTNWLNLHIYYHADHDRLIREAIFPLLANLYGEMAVRRFFFVRYELGGPHIRLRLELPSSQAPLVRHSLLRELEGFLQKEPSLHSMERERIEAINKMLLASDENEHDSRIYEDNTVHEFPFAPEVERYGGSELLPHSLDMFTFTSAESLALIHQAANLSRGEAVTRSIRALIRASLALASRYEEMADIWWPSSRPIAGLSGSDEEIQARRRLEELAWAEISKKDVSWRRWSAAGNSLRRALASAPDAAQARIVRSQIHMFANRLDISNAVERGLGALMAQVFQAHRQEWSLPEPADYEAWLEASCLEAFASLDRAGHSPSQGLPAQLQEQVR